MVGGNHDVNMKEELVLRASLPSQSMSLLPPRGESWYSAEENELIQVFSGSSKIVPCPTLDCVRSNPHTSQPVF